MSLLNSLIFFSIVYRAKSGRYIITWGHHLFLLYIPIEKRPMSFINGLILFSYIFRTKSGHMLLLNGLIFFSIIYQAKSGRYIITLRQHLFLLYRSNEKRPLSDSLTASSISFIYTEVKAAVFSWLNEKNPPVVTPLFILYHPLKWLTWTNEREHQTNHWREKNVSSKTNNGGINLNVDLRKLLAQK